AVLADRLSKCVQLTSNQKGFITGDGIHEAISTLRFLLKHRNDTRIAALDVSKAFDSVNQDAIFVACKRKGLDAASVGLLRNMYLICSTRILLDDITNELIHVPFWVKHGDPLSPVLFCIVMGHLLEGPFVSFLGVVLGGLTLL